MVTEFKSLHPMELTLEISKHISNLQSDLLKRIYDGKVVLEGCEKGDVEIHVHGAVIGTEAENRSELSGSRLRKVCGVFINRSGDSDALIADDEMPVFVWIRNGDKLLRPVRSVVRLQSLNGCRMSLIDSLEKSLTVSPELLRRVLDRELSLLLLRAGIEDGEFKDKIVEACPEIGGDLSDKDREPRWNIARRGVEVEFYVGVRTCIQAGGFPHTLRLSVEESGVQGFQLSKVFHCPVEPDTSAIKGVHAATRSIHGDTSKGYPLDAELIMRRGLPKV